MSYYITSPIYYVNDVPHIGHAYTNIVCDVIARYHALNGAQVFFATGTDEHGQKVAKTAESRGMQPLEYCDQVAAVFRKLAESLGIRNDDFIRTTEPRHQRATQALWERLLANGFIYKGSYAGWYAVRDEAFYQEAELVDGKAPTGAPVEWMEESSYFFKLSAFQDQLLAWYKDNPDCIWPAGRRNEVISFVQSGLKDLSISRSTIKWGVPVPGDSEHVMYVWLDALTNYLSILGYPDETELYKQFWASEEAHPVHVVGKDILRFHAVYWPAFLLAAGLPLPKRIIAHGWWTNAGQKISKSLGNVIDPFALIDQYGLDMVRYFMLREVSFGEDGNFAEEALKRRVNSELANTIGNLAQRALKMLHKELGGVIPTPQALEGEPLLELRTTIVVRYSQAMDNCAFHSALEAIQQLGIEANVYIDREAPWQLKKTDPARMQHVLYVILETLRSIGVMLLPFIPTSAGKLLAQLGPSKPSLAAQTLAHRLQPGTQLPEPFGVFPRVE